MKKIFRFLYDIGLFPGLLFITSCMFLMGIMWNRHYIGFGYIRDTYTEKTVVIEGHFSNTVGGSSGRTMAEVFINEKKIDIPLKKYIPIGEPVTIWYSPYGCGTIDAFVTREGELFIDFQKRMLKNFFKFFMVLNMPLLLLVYYWIKFFREDKKKEPMENY